MQYGIMLAYIPHKTPQGKPCGMWLWSVHKGDAAMTMIDCQQPGSTGYNSATAALMAAEKVIASWKC